MRHSTLPVFSFGFYLHSHNLYYPPYLNPLEIKLGGA